MATRLTALVVGAGAIGSGYDDGRPPGSPLSHAGAYAEHPDIELLGGVDPDEDARRRFTDRWGSPSYAELEDALAAGRPDVVSLCTPVAHRASSVATLLDKDVRAIWCEKPLASTFAEGERIVAACERGGVPLQVNFIRRFDPFHREVRDAIADSGGCRHVDVRYSGSLPDYGTHAVDLFRWLAGQIAWVRAVETDAGAPIVALRAANGATAVLTQVRQADVELFEVDVFTPSRRYVLGGLGEQSIVGTGSPSSLFSGVERLVFDGPPQSGGLAAAMIGGVQALIDHLIDGEPLPCAGADGLAALAVHDAIERSLASGERAEVGGSA